MPRQTDEERLLQELLRRTAAALDLATQLKPSADPSVPDLITTEEGKELLDKLRTEQERIIYHAHRLGRFTLHAQDPLSNDSISKMDQTKRRALLKTLVDNLQAIPPALKDYARRHKCNIPAPTTGSDTHYETSPRARTRAALETTPTPTVGTPDQGDPMSTDSPDSPTPTFSLGRQGRPSRFWRAMRRVAWWLTILCIGAAGVTAPFMTSLLFTGYTPMELYKNHKAAAAAAPDAPVDCTNAFTLDLKGVPYVVIPLNDGAANLYVEGLRLHDKLCYWDDGQTIITNAALTQFRSSFRDAVPTVISSMGMTPPVKVEGSVVMCSPGSGPVANCFEG